MTIRTKEAEKEALIRKNDLEQCRRQHKDKISKWNDAEDNYRDILEKKEDEVFLLKQKLEDTEDSLKATRKKYEKMKDEYKHLNPKNVEMQMEKMKTSIKEAKSLTASLESELFDLGNNFMVKMKSEATLKRQLLDAKKTIKQLLEGNAAESDRVTPLQEAVYGFEIEKEEHKARLHKSELERTAMAMELKLHTSTTLSDIPMEKSYEKSFSSAHDSFLNGDIHHEEILELKSLYEMTKNKLDDAIKENTLLKEELEELADEVVDTAEELEKLESLLVPREKEL